MLLKPEGLRVHRNFCQLRLDVRDAAGRDIPEKLQCQVDAIGLHPAYGGVRPLKLLLECFQGALELNGKIEGDEGADHDDNLLQSMVRAACAALSWMTSRSPLNRCFSTTVPSGVAQAM